MPPESNVRELEILESKIIPKSLNFSPNITKTCQLAWTFVRRRGRGQKYAQAISNVT
jgi:hypothetical protein